MMLLGLKPGHACDLIHVARILHAHALTVATIHLVTTLKAVAFATAAQPITASFGAVGTNVTALLYAVAEAQETLLIKGRHGDVVPTDEELVKLSGFAYMSGVSAATSLLALVNLTHTQPARIGYYEYADPLYGAVPLLRWIQALSLADGSARLLQ
jgi:hypothetical protein